MKFTDHPFEIYPSQMEVPESETLVLLMKEQYLLFFKDTVKVLSEGAHIFLFCIEKNEEILKIRILSRQGPMVYYWFGIATYPYYV